MDNKNKIEKICLMAGKLTEEDFTAFKKIAKEQIEYIHPLKNLKASTINETGKHNMQVLEALKNLHDVIHGKKRRCIHIKSWNICENETSPNRNEICVMVPRECNGYETE